MGEYIALPRSGWRRAAGGAMVGTAVAGGLLLSSSAPARCRPAGVVARTGDPSGTGYWVTDPLGDVYGFGSALNYGSMAGRHLNAPIVGIVAAPDGKGYWLVGKDGGVFAFGSARFLNSMPGGTYIDPDHCRDGGCPRAQLNWWGGAAWPYRTSGAARCHRAGGVG